jgi:hypothetical protein
MAQKIVAARTIKINRTTALRASLEHYCRDPEGEPRSWMEWERDWPR